MKGKDQYPPGYQPLPGGGGYSIIIGGPPPPPHEYYEHPPQQQPPNTPQQADQLHRARLRAMHANCRPLEAGVILEGLYEIRAALNIQSITVADGDSGSGERPPLEPAFDELNRGRLQHSYLYLAERYCNYVDWMLVNQLDKDFPITNEIKKKAPESKPVEDGIHERSGEGS